MATASGSTKTSRESIETQRIHWKNHRHTQIVGRIKKRGDKSNVIEAVCSFAGDPELQFVQHLEAKLKGQIEKYEIRRQKFLDDFFFFFMALKKIAKFNNLVDYYSPRSLQISPRHHHRDQQCTLCSRTVMLLIGYLHNLANSFLYF